MTILKIFCWLLFTQLFLLISASCSNFEIADVENSQKIAVMPLTNLTGYDLTKFPLLIYKDSELARLFNSLPPKTTNLANLLEFELERKIDEANVDFVTALEIQQKIGGTADYSAQRKIVMQKFQAELAAHLVIKRINVSKIFTDKKIVIYAGFLIVATETGDLLSKIEEEFVFELPKTVFSPLGADLSKAITDIKKYIIQQLLGG